MRYVEGTDLRATIDEQGALEPARAARSSARSPRHSQQRTGAGSSTGT